MSDPQRRLNEFGSSFEGGVMPMSAAEIRRRGDQIRRRRHALVAGAAVAAVVAVAVPVAVVGSPGDPDSAPPAHEPTATDTAVVTPGGAITRANLLTPGDLAPAEGIVAHTGATYAGDGSARLNPCQESSLSGLGATSIIQRDFGFSAVESGDADVDHHLNEAVAQFPTAADARAAAAEIATWTDDCLPVGATSSTSAPWRGVDVPGAEARVGSVDYRPGDAIAGSQYDASGRDDLVWHLESATVVAGDRLAMVTELQLGSDAAVEPRSLEAVLPAAAQRLVAAEPSVEDTSPAPSGVGVIPDDFPLAAGWPDETEAERAALRGPNRTLPSLEFSACDTDFSDPEHVDRLRADWVGEAEDFRARQLTVYADADAAADAVDELVDLFRACPTGPVRDDGFRTEYEVVRIQVADGADEVWGVGQRDTLAGGETPYGQTTAIVRDAASVLVLDHGGEAGYPSGETDDAVADLLNEAGEAIGAMRSIQEPPEDGAPESEPDEPARAATVPADFPIDASLGGSGTSEGPGRDLRAVAPNTICGQDLSIPTYDNTARAGRLEYHVADEAVSDGRMVAAFPTEQDAIDTMTGLRSQIASCDRDSGGDGLADRLWTAHETRSGYDSVSFSWTYELRSGVGAPAGVLYTATRVGSAILVVVWQSEGSADHRAGQVADQLRLVDAIAPEMCIFTADGC